ncbi:DUF5615 family PIN-like protein [Hymenobacter caeli]|uniref:DUF5615 family PIN-like protein n=1 Tax=Hymenobacter caeli TaxID=2735894 RepID=UPI001570C0CF
MKVICDVHLSVRLTKFLVTQGIDAMHVNALPKKSETTDAEISAYADLHGYVVFTKDEDFRTSYLLQRTPRKLVHIRTGNGLRDREALELIGRHLAELTQLDNCATFYLEMDAEQLTVIVAT